MTLNNPLNAHLELQSTRPRALPPSPLFCLPQRPLPIVVVGLGRHLEGLAQLPHTSLAPGGLTAHVTDLPDRVGRSNKARSNTLSFRSSSLSRLPLPAAWSAQYPPQGPPHATSRPSWGAPQNGRPLGTLWPCPTEARPRPPSPHRGSFAQVDHDAPQLGPLLCHAALRTQLPPSPPPVTSHP